MTLPSTLTLTFLDQASDDVAQARAQIKAIGDAANTLKDHLAASPLTSGATPATAGGGLEIVATVLQGKYGVTTKTAGYTAVTTDRGKLIDFTTAGVTLAFDPVATLTDGWYCLVRNSAASGVVTLNPNGSEQIDGLTSIDVPPGQGCMVLCNGSLLRTIGIPSFALQADQEAATSARLAVTPAVQQFHASACKGWAKLNFTGSAPASYNVASVTDTGAGIVDIAWATDFSSGDYVVLVSVVIDPGGTAALTNLPLIANTLLAAGTTRLYSINMSTFGGADSNFLMVGAFGDQP